MLTFDEDGYLTPDEPIEVDFETFIREFVINEHRADIFTEYRQMLTDLSSLSPGAFYQWINGSFVTRKARPKDIDVATFLSQQIYDEFEPLFRELRLKYPKVDAYFVKVYPEGHPRGFITEFDQIEWRHLFSTDRRRRRKGFIHINF